MKRRFVTCVQFIATVLSVWISVQLLPLVWRILENFLIFGPLEIFSFNNLWVNCRACLPVPWDYIILLVFFFYSFGFDEINNASHLQWPLSYRGAGWHFPPVGLSVQGGEQTGGVQAHASCVLSDVKVNTINSFPSIPYVAHSYVGRFH